MKLKKLLTMALAGALLIGGVVTANAAELDTAWYAEKNPDVVAEVGSSPEALELHYEMYGKKEARMANSHDVEAQLRKLFKAEEYGALYPDVKEYYGEDEEAMFQHYISYGLLEARRPSEKVTVAAARSLKETVEKAMADAGLTVAPGSADLVAVIEGTVSEEAGSVEVVQALAEVATVVEKAVADTYEEVTNPKPAPSNNSGSSSSSSGDTMGCIITHSAVHIGETCVICGYPGEAPHTFTVEDKTGKCNETGCKGTCDHKKEGKDAWNAADGTCTVCGVEHDHKGNWDADTSKCTCGMTCPNEKNHSTIKKGEKCDPCGHEGELEENS